MSQDELDYDEDFPAVIYVVEGQVVGLTIKGVETRAKVCTYPAVFPCVASAIEQDADGEFYMATIV